MHLTLGLAGTRWSLDFEPHTTKANSLAYRNGQQCNVCHFGLHACPLHSHSLIGGGRLCWDQQRWQCWMRRDESQQLAPNADCDSADRDADWDSADRGRDESWELSPGELAQKSRSTKDSYGLRARLWYIYIYIYVYMYIYIYVCVCVCVLIRFGESYRFLYRF